MDKEATVLFAAYEAMNESNSREKTRIIIAFLVVIVLLIAGWASTVGAFLYYQSLYDYVGTEQSIVEIQADNGVANYAEGDVNYGLYKENDNNNETEG